jgi:phosphoribosyl-dephospho-CoA transferase
MTRAAPAYGDHGFRHAKLRPHDLLTPASAGDLVGEDPPAWVREDLSVMSMVVVRRAEARDGLVPVGVRGKNRDRRFAAHLPLASVIRTLTPEMLARAAAWRTARRSNDLPHFAVLDPVARLFDEAALVWGPTGSMGYELASGAACLTATSDIDLVVRAPVALSRVLSASLYDSLRRLPVRVDAQIETPSGAVALAEYASGVARFALRTSWGPRFVDDPWREWAR